MSAASLDSGAPAVLAEQPVSRIRQTARRVIPQVLRYGVTRDFSPFPMPWLAASKRRDAMDALHLKALDLQRKDVSQAAAILGTALYPLTLPFWAGLEMWRHGGTVRRLGVSLPRQMGEILTLGLRHNIAPESYYMYRLFRPGNRGSVRYLLQDYERRYLFIDMVRGLPWWNTQDKQRFARICADHDLPTPPILAIFDGKGGGMPPEDLPRTDLFAKPLGGSLGRLAASWRYDPATGLWTGGGRTFDAAGLVAELEASAQVEPMLLQPTVRPAAELAPLSHRGLATVRVLTLRDAAGKVHVLLATFRMPVGDMVVDHFANGGLAAGVDLSTGWLSRAVYKDLRHGECSHHPDTGAPIEGYRLPDWDGVGELVQRAHQAFAELPVIGWDIAWSDEGLTIIEGNSTSSLDLLQVTNATPIGLTDFSRLFRARIGAVPQATP